MASLSAAQHGGTASIKLLAELRADVLKTTNERVGPLQAAALAGLEMGSRADVADRAVGERHFSYSFLHLASAEHPHVAQQRVCRWQA